jgi:nucleoside-diphosphate-sugar epimerase
MIIGNGQIAQALRSFDRDDICFFASGVSDSGCTDTAQFDREKRLLDHAFKEFAGLRFVYFSSAALSAGEYPINQYYQHKIEVEKMLGDNSSAALILRIPQLLGPLRRHPTIINHFFYSIMLNKEIYACRQAYRYIIDVKDVCTLVLSLLNSSIQGGIFNLANPHRYSIPAIIRSFEDILGVHANCIWLDKHDGYDLDLAPMLKHISLCNLSVPFSEEYLYLRLRDRVEDFRKSGFIDLE